jgi:hypothetical protein
MIRCTFLPIRSSLDWVYLLAVYLAVQKGDSGLTFVMYSEARGVLFVYTNTKHRAVQNARKK